MLSLSFVGESTALPLLNAVRSKALDGLKSWRPVGISVGDSVITYLESSQFVEIPQRVCLDLSDCVYTPKGDMGNVEFVKDTIKVSSQLFAEDIGKSAQSSFIVKGDTSNPILTPKSGEFELTIYYRYSTGIHTNEQNGTFLREHIGNGGYMSMSSRHTDVDTFIVRSEEIDLTRHKFEVEIRSAIDNEEQIWLEALAQCKDALNTISRVPFEQN